MSTTQATIQRKLCWSINTSTVTCTSTCTKVKKAIIDGCGLKGFSTFHRISQNNLQNFTEYAIKEISVQNIFSKVMISLKTARFSWWKSIVLNCPPSPPQRNMLFFWHLCHALVIWKSIENRFRFQSLNSLVGDWHLLQEMIWGLIYTCAQGIIMIDVLSPLNAQMGIKSVETFHYYDEIHLSTLFSQTTEVCVIPCIQLLHFGTLRKT